MFNYIKSLITIKAASSNEQALTPSCPSGRAAVTPDNTEYMCHVPLHKELCMHNNLIQNTS